jgi:hypothetical protein
VKSRTLMAVGLALLLAAGLLAAWAGFSNGSTKVTTSTFVTNGKTTTVRTVEALPGKNYTTTVTHGGATRTVRVPVAGPPSVRTVRPPAVASTRTITQTHAVTTARTVTSVIHQIQTVVHSVTTTVPGGTRTIVQTVTTPGASNTVTETVTVKPGGGPCPPRNPHC